MRRRLPQPVRRLLLCASSVHGDGYWADGGVVVCLLWGWSVTVADGGTIAAAAEEQVEATGRAGVAGVVGVVDVALVPVDARR